MIRTILIAAAALAGSTSLAFAQDMANNPPIKTIVCLDVGGQSLPAVCKVPGSRLDKREDFCSCPQGMRVDAPVCADGQSAPAESAAYDRARKTAGRDGSLIGDLFEGRAMCVAPRNP